MQRRVPIKLKNQKILTAFPWEDLTTFKNNWKDYSKQSHEGGSTKNWQELSLLISEIQFLNVAWSDAVQPKPILIYVGSAPGTHLYSLINIFPWFEYHLYDQGKMDEKIKDFALEQASENFGGVHLHELFDDEAIKFWSKRKDVFMIFNITKDLPNEILVEALNFQENCLKEIFPIKSLLHLRFPNSFVPDLDKSEDEQHYSFFEGIAYRRAFSDLPGEFSLLVTDNVTVRLWNVPELEEAIQNHNEVIRRANFFVPNFSKEGENVFLSEELGLVKNFDGVTLFMTIEAYLCKFRPFNLRNPSFEEVLTCIAKLLTFEEKNRLKVRKLKVKNARSP